MNKTGDLLKKAREEKGLSLNEVGLSLKISSKILKAIEENDTANLPAKTFLRGFVQSYAAFLRMDVDSVMSSFYEEVGTTRPQPLLRTTAEEIDPSTTSGELKSASTGEERPAATPAPEKRTPPTRQQDHLAPINEKSNTKAIIIAVIGAVLLGLILFTKKMIDKYSKEAKVDNKVSVSAPLTNPSPEAPVSNSENEPPTPEAAPVDMTSGGNTSNNAPAPMPTPSVIASLTSIKTKASPAPSPIASPSVKASPTPSPAPSPTLKSSPSPTPTPSAKPSPSPVATSASPTPTPTPSPSPSKTPDKPTSKSVELIIEALDDVSIDYASNNGKKSSIKLSAGQVHTFKSKDGLKLDISNGGAVNLILNGRDLEIPGDLGKPIKLSY